MPQDNFYKYECYIYSGKVGKQQQATKTTKTTTQGRNVEWRRRRIWMRNSKPSKWDKTNQLRKKQKKKRPRKKNRPNQTKWKNQLATEYRNQFVYDIDQRAIELSEDWLRKHTHSHTLTHINPNAWPNICLTIFERGKQNNATNIYYFRKAPATRTHDIFTIIDF